MRYVSKINCKKELVDQLVNDWEEDLITDEFLDEIIFLLEDEIMVDDYADRMIGLMACTTIVEFGKWIEIVNKWKTIDRDLVD